jgi:prepilin-type N-terminal cleavage/methylation domain-containing protein
VKRFVRPAPAHCAAFAPDPTAALRPRTAHAIAQRGVTLIELSVGVFILSLLAALALPHPETPGPKARVTVVATDLRTFTPARQTCNLQNGKWPADVTPGLLPKAMVGALPAAFIRKTPIGDNYGWDQKSPPTAFSPQPPSPSSPRARTSSAATPPS